MTKLIYDRPVEDWVNDIPFDRYITRPELFLEKWKVPDRKGRDIINQIRKIAPKYVIISSSSQKGYKRPSTYDEIEMCLKESEARMKEEMAKQKQLRRLLKNKDQLGLGIAI